MLTLLDCHPKRGKEAFADMAVLPFFSGVLDHRRVEAVLVGRRHRACPLCALTCSTTWPPSPARSAHREWADEMADLLVEVKDAVEQALFEGSSGLSAGQLKAYRSRYTKLVNRGFAAVPARHRAGSVHRDAYNLLSPVPGPAPRSAAVLVRPGREL